jgi:hypothetical protein
MLFSNYCMQMWSSYMYKDQTRGGTLELQGVPSNTKNYWRMDTVIDPKIKAMKFYTGLR